MQPRILTLRVESTLYVVAEASGDETQFVRRTGLTSRQFIADILMRITNRLGSGDDGAFHGTVVNDVMPLCDADSWDERNDADESRTWRTEGALFRFRPYTSADVFTVMRCGRPAVYLDRYGTMFAAMSQGGDGLQATPADEAEPLVRPFLAATGLPVIDDCDNLRDYVDSHGNLTY